jgi:hypothetical protein
VTAPKPLRMFGQEIPWCEHPTNPNWYRAFSDQWPFIVSVHPPDGRLQYFAHVTFAPLGLRSHNWSAQSDSPSDAIKKVTRKIRRDLLKALPTIVLAFKLTGIKK